MDNGFKPPVVHETEAQRQHPRVRIPATVRFTVAGREQSCRVHDVSAGGFSFDGTQSQFNIGESYRGSLNFAVDPLGLTLPIRFQVRNVDASTRRVGCSFQDMKPSQTSVLRYLITAYLGGELISVGEVLTTLSRDNFTKPRALAHEAVRPAAERTRAVAVTAAVFVLGALAFTYTLSKLYGVLFVTHAIGAKVAAPSFTVSMPRDGTFFSLVPEDGIVKKGQAIGSFQAAMLDVVQGDPGALKLTPAQLSDLMGQTLKGTLSSPCDCKVHQQYATDSQYINRNQPLMELAPVNAKSYVLARFHFDNIGDLATGRQVRFRISGEASDRTGKISQLRLLPTPLAAVEAGGSSDVRGLSANGAVSDVLVEIEPTKPIDAALLDRPVDVRVGDLVSRLSLSSLLPG